MSTPHTVEQYSKPLWHSIKSILASSWCWKPPKKWHIANPRSRVNLFFSKSPTWIFTQKRNPPIHPGRLTWNIQITHLERKMIFQTFMIMFHVNLQGCILSYPFRVTSRGNVYLDRWSDSRCLRVHLAVPKSSVVGAFEPHKHLKKRCASHHLFGGKRQKINSFSSNFKGCYCWRKKSCTTKQVWNPANTRIFYISTGAEFLPSTVSQIPPKNITEKTHPWRKIPSNFQQIKVIIKKKTPKQWDFHQKTQTFRIKDINKKTNQNKGT